MFYITLDKAVIYEYFNARWMQLLWYFAQSAEAEEYTDYISAQW